MEEINNELKCKTHKRLACHLRTKLQADQPSYLLCDKCVSKFQLRENLISLLDVKQFEDNSFIENWPQGLDERSFEFMKSSASVNYQKNLINKLNEFQENLIYEISKKIKDVFIKQFEILKNKVPENRLIEEYHTLFQTHQLIDIVNQFEEQKYQSFLSEFDQTRKAKTEQFLTSIELFKQCENLIQFDKLEVTKQLVLDILSEMKFFSNDEFYNNKDLKNDNKEIQQSEQQMKGNEYLLMILTKANQYQKSKDNPSKDIIKLLEKKREIEVTGFDKSMTKQLYDQTLKYISEDYNTEDIKQVLQTFPIFDLCTKKLPIFPKNILEIIQLEKTTFQNGQNRIEISKNNLNQYQACISNSYQLTKTQRDIFANYTNCVSNLVIEKNKKYVFRIHIKSTGSYPLIGLMSNANSNLKNGFEEKLSFHLKFENGTLIQGNNYGISQKIKGDNIKLPTEITLEMRVWQEGQLLEVLDYPNYQYKVSLLDEHKPYLKTKEDLKLYLFLYNKEMKYTLSRAFIVEKFD